MNAIVLGASGQDGYYLSKLLSEQGFEILGISRSGGFLQLDITDFGAVKNMIKQIKPAYIFHLAANSTTRHDAWKENHDIISTGSLNILEAVREVSPETKIFLSGSGLQFVNSGKPIKESDPFDASSPYALSRIHAAFAGRYYRRLGIKVYMGYLFNHDSPLRSSNHISKKITRAVQKVKSGADETIEIGDLTVKKEWGFAGDIVRGIWTLVQQDDVFESIIGTGLAYSIQEWLSICFSIIDKDWRDYVKPVKNFQSEYNTLVSDPSLIKSLGWRPEVSFQELASMMIENENG
jgi:GDPmannose 4,6-dehydratase